MVVVPIFLIEFTKTNLVSVFVCGSWRLLCFQSLDLTLWFNGVFPYSPDFYVCCISSREMFSMSSHDVLFLWDVSDEIWGRIFSSCYDPVLPPAMQWQCPKQDEAYCSKSGEEYEWCVHFFRSAASWWLYQLLPAWLAVWLRCCLRSRKQPPLFPLSSTCRNRPIGQCSTLPWRCRGVFFSGLFRHFRSVFLRFSGLTHPLFLFCQEFLYGWVHLDVPSVRYGRGYDWIRIFILWATSQLLWVQLLLLVIVFHV